MATEAELFGNSEAAGETAEAVESPVTQDGAERRTETKPDSKSWRDDPEFKQWQSKLDKRYDSERKEKEALAARLAQYEQSLDVLATKDLDDVGKLRYENQKLQRLMQAMQQEKQVAEGRQRVFNRIRQKAGMPIPDEVFEEANDADHAWELAYDYVLQRNTPAQKAAAKAEKREANQVYMGSNPATLDDMDAQLNKAFKDGDVREYMRLLRVSRQKE